MIKKFTLLASVLLISGCAGIIQPKSCYKTVALTRLTLTEVAKSVNASAKNDLASLGDNENAAKIVKTASSLTSKALPLCAVDKKEAFKILDNVNSLVTGIENNEQ